MTVFERMMEDFVLLTKSQKPDGESGMETSWEEEKMFPAVATNENTVPVRIAEADGFTSVFTITTKRDTLLKFHDVIRRKSDGKVFRITSESQDNCSPDFSDIDLAQASAERWKLT